MLSSVEGTRRPTAAVVRARQHLRKKTTIRTYLPTSLPYKSWEQNEKSNANTFGQCKSGIYANKNRTYYLPNLSSEQRATARGSEQAGCTRQAAALDWALLRNVFRFILPTLFFLIFSCCAREEKIKLSRRAGEGGRSADGIHEIGKKRQRNLLVEYGTLVSDFLFLFPAGFSNRP